MLKNFLIAVLLVVFSTQAMAAATGLSFIDSGHSYSTSKQEEKLASGVALTDPKISFAASKQVEKFAPINESAENSPTSHIEILKVLPDVEEMSDYIPLFAPSKANSDNALSPLGSVDRFISISLFQTPPPPRP